MFDVKKTERGRYNFQEDFAAAQTRVGFEYSGENVDCASRNPVSIERIHFIEFSRVWFKAC